MNTLKLSGEALETAKTIRRELERMDAESRAIHAKAVEDLDALRLDHVTRMKVLWSDLVKQVGFSQEDLSNHLMDFTYLEDHGLVFLKPAPGGEPSLPSDPLQSLRSETLQ